MKNKDKAKPEKKEEVKNEEVIEEIKDNMEELLNNKIKDLESALLRNQAELQNYKRRQDRKSVV